LTHTSLPPCYKILAAPLHSRTDVDPPGSNYRRAGAYRLAAPGAIPYFDFEVMELEHNKALAEQSRAGKQGRWVLQLSADV